MLGHHELSELVLLFCDLASSKLLFLAREHSWWLASVLPLASIGRDELVRSAGTGETQSRRRRRGDGGQTAWWRETVFDTKSCLQFSRAVDEALWTRVR